MTCQAAGWVAVTDEATWATRTSTEAVRDCGGDTSSDQGSGSWGQGSGQSTTWRS